MNSILRRRRALMGVKKEIPPTKLEAGTFTRGSSEWTVDSNGKVTIINWAQSTTNAIITPVETPFDIKNGDNIVFYLFRKSGSPSWHGTDVNLYKSATSSLINLGNNLSWNWSNNTNSVSKTSTVSGTVTHIYINNRGNPVAESANYAFAIKITVNGKDVLI